MKLSKSNKLIDFFIALSCSLVIFIPGLKFFYFSSVVNFSVLMLLVASIIVSCAIYRVRLNKEQGFYILYISLVFLILFLSGLFPDHSVTFTSIIRYISVWLMLICVVILSPKIKIDYICNIVIAWSILLAICYRINLVEASGEGELSYLILAMQLGVGFAVSVSKTISLNKTSLIYGIISLFILYCILTLAGRAALIGCIFVVMSVSLSMINYQWKRKPLLIVFIFTSVLILVYFAVDYLLENVLNEYLLYKLTQSSSSSNSRLSYYIQSLDIIADHPFGLGLHKYNTVLGFYPHNIFLEMGMNAGIIAMLILLLPFVIFLKKLLSVCIDINKSVCLPVANLTLFLTFCWMFSNNLASSYALFTAMIVFFQKGSELKSR